jgi:2-dehydropantoate 2-reductase
VHFLMRSDATEIRRSGIRIQGRSESIHVAQVNQYASTGEIGPCDLVLISVKSTSNGDLPKLIPPLLHRSTMLLTLQNGFGNEEFLAENFGEERILGALCFVCVNRTSPGVIEDYYPGRVRIGEHGHGPQQRTHDIVREFQRCGVECGVVENLALERWRKLVWNIPFNGLSIASGGIDTAAILSDAPLRRECLGLMEEVILAAQKCGFLLPDGIVQEEIRRTESMGPYKPSTLVDFEAGRPLEIEAIWGEPLRRAEAVGATAPRLRALYTTLKRIDSARRRQEGPQLNARQGGK